MPVAPLWHAHGPAGGRVHLYAGDAGAVLRCLPAGSAQCCVTSPPYFGQRDYGGGGAEIGRERTVAEYIARLVGVLREVRRVLRDDGTLWLNVGDCWQGRRDGGTAGAPWRLAFALEGAGWVLRQDLVWHKTNAMPDGSARDRFVRAHEYLFLFTKGRRYYFDPEAVRSESGALARSVWPLATASWRGAHYAVFPPKLVGPCILAGTSAAGACSRCGAPLPRQVRREGGARVPREAEVVRDRSFRWSRNGRSGCLDGAPARVVTLGWRRSCDCPAEAGTRPCVVLDPFVGSGTTADVALRSGRSCVGIDLSREYLEKDAVPRLRDVISSMGPEATNANLP